MKSQGESAQRAIAVSLEGKLKSAFGGKEGDGITTTPESKDRCRVLVISATLDDGGEGEALAAGADACLSKGLSRSDICAAAMRLVNR